MASQLENFKSDPSESHSLLMSITVWMQCGVAAFFLSVRFMIQKAQQRLWTDDLLLAIAWFFLLCQAILNQLSINLGFGKHALDIDFSHFDRITYYGATALTVSLAAITISKISFGVTLLRLTDGYLKMYVWFAIVTMAIFAIPAGVLLLDPEPSIIYGRFQAVWSALMDFSLALIPWKILLGLQMRSAEKIGAGIAMSLGLLAGATAILRARYVELLAHQDLSYDAYNSVIWSVAEASMTMVATSIPVLRVFVRRVTNSAMENFRYNVAHGKSSRTGGSSNPSGYSKRSH
ncbi:unnamed protein product, partial [Alternaria alternata]